jgi:hypothetical protein
MQTVPNEFLMIATFVAICIGGMCFIAGVYAAVAITERASRRGRQIPSTGPQWADFRRDIREGD